MTDITKLPYAEWLEESVGEIIKAQPEQIGIVAICPDGRTLTGYYNADATAMAMMAHTINADAVMDVVVNNIGMVRDALDELEEEGEPE